MKELKDLQVGDEVIIRRLSNKTLGKVERITKTLIVVDGVKYNKKSGKEVNGDKWVFRVVSVPMIGEVEKARADTFRNFIYNFCNDKKLDTLSADKLQQIYKIIKSE